MKKSKSKSSEHGSNGGTPAQKRIDKAAYELFSRFGIRAVSVDQVIAKSKVAKATMYRHYPTKEHLALSFLRLREELWTHELQLAVDSIDGPLGMRLLAVFSIFDEWFQRPDFDGCAFVNVMLETSKNSIVRNAAISHLTTIRKFLEKMAVEAGIKDSENFGWKWHILMKGSIVAAAEGDRTAARRARQIGELLLVQEGMDFTKGTVSTLSKKRLVTSQISSVHEKNIAA